MVFILVHGGFHGGWCWQRVARQLRARGHEVLTPTLTGLGERSHLLQPTIDLDTHIADVCGVLRWEGVDDAVLVGHSYGGMVITAVADRMPERLAQLVYLDGMLPVDGESTNDTAGDGPTQRAVMAGQADPMRISLEGMEAAYAEQMGVNDPDDVAWVAGKVTAHPAASFLQPIALRATSTVPMLYVRCEHSLPGVLDSSYERARVRVAEDPKSRFEVLGAGHDAMITHPDEVTELLVSVG